MGFQFWVFFKFFFIGLIVVNYSKLKLIKCFIRIKDFKIFLFDKKFMKEQVICEYMNDSYLFVFLYKYK